MPNQTTGRYGGDSASPPGVVGGRAAGQADDTCRLDREILKDRRQEIADSPYRHSQRVELPALEVPADPERSTGLAYLPRPFQRFDNKHPGGRHHHVIDTPRPPEDGSVMKNKPSVARMRVQVRGRDPLGVPGRLQTAPGPKLMGTPDERPRSVASATPSPAFAVHGFLLRQVELAVMLGDGRVGCSNPQLTGVSPGGPSARLVIGHQMALDTESIQTGENLVKVVDDEDGLTHGGPH